MKRQAFTLIEVLVVTSIIALLVAITMPSLSEARRISKRTKCLHNLHQVGVALQAYLQTHKDVFPYICHVPSIEEQIARDNNRPPYAPIYKALAREVGARSYLFECPADTVTKLPEQPPLPAWRIGGRYFDVEKTSYGWTVQVNGLHRHTRKVDYQQVPVLLKDLWVLQDYEHFHGGPNRPRSLNSLYADLRVETVK